MELRRFVFYHLAAAFGVQGGVGVFRFKTKISGPGAESEREAAATTRWAYNLRWFVSLCITVSTLLVFSFHFIIIIVAIIL